MDYRTLSVILILGALLSMGLQYRHYRRGIFSRRRAITGGIARFGFLVLGVMYLTGLPQQWRLAPFVGIGIVVLGVILHLGNNIIENTQRER